MFQHSLYRYLLHRHLLFRIAICFVALVVCSATACSAMALALEIGRSEIPGGWRDDATLHDVCFVNSTNGWAVGNQGVILRTTDGGQSWVELQNIGRSAGNEKDLSSKLRSLTPLDQAGKTLPLTCRWHNVHFVDDKNGWVVGSSKTAYVGDRQSIVMHTTNGGQTWGEIHGLVLPMIKRLHFDDLNNGWAIGSSSDFYPSGMFRTNDRGRAWQISGRGKSKSWVDGDKVGSSIVAVDITGSVFVSQNNGMSPANLLDRKPNQAGKIRAIRMLDENSGWAVGDAGCVLQTRDGGKNWFTPASVRTSQDIQLFDFCSLKIVDQKVMFCGNPGTYVWSLSHDGKELEKHRTPQAMPLNKIEFASPTFGWAVGDMGTVIATGDGGATWEIQRQADSRLSVLAIAETSEKLPLSFLATYAGEKNFLSGIYVPETVGSESADAQTIADAASEIGNSVYQFDRQPNSADSMRRLVRTIRTLQPQVIICDSSLQTKCQRAIADAANPNRFTPQLIQQGLTPTRVQRLLTPSQSETGESQIAINNSSFLPGLSSLLEDQIAIPSALLGLSIRRGGEQRFDCQNYFTAPQIRGNDAFYGLHRRGSGLAKRKSESQIGSLGAVQRAAQKNRQFKLLLSQNGSTAVQRVTWRRQLQMFGNGSDSRQVGVWMWQLADEYFRQGDFVLAAATLENMSGRFSKHPLTLASITWLANYYTSQEFLPPQVVSEPENEIDPDLAEIDQLLKESQPEVVGFDSEVKELDVNGVKHMIWQSLDEKKKVAQASFETESRESIRSGRLSTASRFVRLIEQRYPQMSRHPDVRFMKATITRHIDGVQAADNMFRLISKEAAVDSAARRNATREFQIREDLKRRENELSAIHALPRLNCTRAQQRPHLDGKLEDDVWQNAMSSGKVNFQKMVERPSAQPKTDILMFAHDDQFLYVAARCHKIDGQSYLLTETPRPRDPVLSNRDRLQLTLDIDRDYRSGYTFTIDYRGWVSDGCSGSGGWNPDWFVAAHHEKSAWSVECAIPLNEINLSATDPAAFTKTISVAAKRLNYYSQLLWRSTSPTNVSSRQTGQRDGLLHAIKPARHDYQLLELGASQFSAETK